MTRGSVGPIQILVIMGMLVACRQGMPVPRAEIDDSQQLVVVTTPNWTSTVGTMVRFERATSTSAWTRIESPIPVVVGRTGIAWGVGFDSASTEGPHKHEGDGKAPAGIFPLDTAFGFASRDSMQRLVQVFRDCNQAGFCTDVQFKERVPLPYVQLLPTTDCVDDTASAHYNTVVDKTAVSRVDWNSAEHMREVSQYEIGVIVGYNAPSPVEGRGSCIFLHIWAGPDSHTAGCTAFDEVKLREVMLWLDPRKRPLLVQLTADEYTRLRPDWRLPPVPTAPGT